MLSVAVSNWSGTDQSQAFSILSDLPNDQKSLSANPADYFLANSILLMHLTKDSGLSGFGDVAGAALEQLNPSLARSMTAKYTIDQIDLSGFDSDQIKNYGDFFSGAARYHLDVTGAANVADNIRSAHAELFGSTSSTLESLPWLEKFAAKTENIFPVLSYGSIWQQGAELMDAMAKQGNSIEVLASGTTGEEAAGGAQNRCTFSQENACDSAAKIIVQTPYLTAGVVKKALTTSSAKPWEILGGVTDPQSKIEEMENLVQESETLTREAKIKCLVRIARCGPTTGNNDRSATSQSESGGQSASDDQTKTPTTSGDGNGEKNGDGNGEKNGDGNGQENGDGNGQENGDGAGQGVITNPITSAVDSETCYDLGGSPEECGSIPGEEAVGGTNYCEGGMDPKKTGCKVPPSFGLGIEATSVPGTDGSESVGEPPPMLRQDEEIPPLPNEFGSEP